MAKKIPLSIIIPCRNSAKTLKKLLNSIFHSSFFDFEVIIVDDDSEDNTQEVAKKFPVRYFRLEKRRGPSVARNTGARLAKGQILFFLDADAIVFKDTISEMMGCFKKNPKTSACTGRVSWKKPANPNLFTKWKALRDYGYWSVERQKKYITTVGGMISAYKKEAFWDVGGFNSVYKTTDNEDFEFAFRFNQKYKVCFNPKLKVLHHYSNFGETTKKYFKRAYSWSGLFARNKTFYNEGANPKEAFIGFLAPVCLIFLALVFLVPILFWFFLGLFLFRLILSYKFLLLTYREEGFLFMIYGALVSFWIHLVIYAGAFYWILVRPCVWFRSLGSNRVNLRGVL